MKYEKKIIWIDDGIDQMELIARETFLELWKVGVFNQTLFFGDFEREVQPNNLKSFQLMINDLFYRLCVKYGIANGYNGDDYPELKNLYEAYSKEKNIEDIAVSLHLTDDLIDNEKMKMLVNKWKDLTNKDTIWGERLDMTNEEYKVDSIFSHIEDPGKCSFALDLILLKGDEEKLNCNEEQSTPVISIELYHFITSELKAKCVLYSMDTCLNRVPNNWKKLYKQRYGDTELDIIPRELLHSGSLNNTELEKLKNLF